MVQAHEDANHPLSPTHPMDSFFEPQQLSITHANDSVQFIDVSLSSSLGFICFTAIAKQANGTGLEGIPPLLNLRGVYLKFGCYLVDGFVATHGGKGYLSFLLGRKLSSHKKTSSPTECTRDYTGKEILLSCMVLVDQFNADS
jgi:hypothetical protein